MHIRSAQPADIPQIVSLWQISFGDSADYIQSFLEAMGQHRHCLVCESDGEVVSMLFMLPATMSVAGEMRPMFYLYACATLPAARGKGLMRSLLDAAHARAVARSAYGVILIPATENLAAYYSKNGFAPFFNNYEFAVADDELRQQAKSLMPEDFTRIETIRRNYLKSDWAVHWPDDYLNFALQQLAEDDGKVWFGENAFVLFDAEGEIVEALPLQKYLRHTHGHYALMRTATGTVFPAVDENPYFNFGLD